MLVSKLLRGGWSDQALLLGFLALFLATNGCDFGGAMSQADLRRYAIDRGSDDEEEEDDQPSSPAANPQVTTAAAIANNNETAPTAEKLAASSEDESAGSESRPARGDAPSPVNQVSETAVTAVINTSASSSAAATTATIASLPTIAQRKPNQPLSESQRRERAVKNLEVISSAVIEWLEGSFKVPVNHVKNSRGRPVLSWRVHILPMLGYQDLYNQFDLEQPWDSEHNQRLLELIPDEYASPERFDENTNYQLLVNGQALFTEKEQRDKGELSDAPNILMLVETDDELAVPWTAPFDYDTTQEPLGHGLGNLRSDGTFVAWMSGKVSVWPNPLDQVMFFRAITFEAGDTFPVAIYQRYPEIGSSGERPSLGQMEPSSIGQSTVFADSQAGFHSPSEILLDGQALPRFPLPPREQILESEQKLKSTYLNAFNNAKSTTELSQLANTIVRQLTDGASPPSDLFVGLRTALKISISARDPSLALRIIDDLDARFEIRREDFEQIAFDGFLGEGGSLRTDFAKAVRLLPVGERLVHADIADDDFRAAEEIVDNARIVLRSVADRETQYRWSVLRKRVEEGKRLFSRVAKYLETLEENRDDPAALEAVGWYLCLIKDNWGEGLRMLAKSPDTELRELAQLELLAEGQLDQHIRLADAWWTYAEGHKDDVLAFNSAMERARKWYMSASLALSDGLDRIRARNRLQSIDRMIGKLPDATGVPERSF